MTYDMISVSGLHVATNAVSAVAYAIVAIATWSLMRRFPQLATRPVVALAILFFVGATLSQVLDALKGLIAGIETLYAITEVITAILAMCLGAVLIPRLHQMIARNGSLALAATNQRLLSEITNRSAIARQLESTREDLERRVRERTAEIEATNAALKAEIRERVGTEKALKLAKERAEGASRSKSEFLANMSHEIRTPMTAIVGFADMLADSQLTRAEHMACVDSIRRNGDALLKIIDDILDLARVELGSVELEKERFKLGQILHEVRTILEPQANERGLEFDIITATPVPDVIESDPVRIRQVLINLIGNAIKFTRRGFVRIELAFDSPAAPVGVSEANGDSDLPAQNPDTSDESRIKAGAAGPIRPRLVIRVVDSGCGISAEQKPRLFRPFVQADSSITRRYGGTGLGLALSLKLARSLGGDLSLTWSKPGQGSVFTFVVDPGDVSAAALVTDLGLSAGDSRSVHSRDVESDRVRLDGMQILVVEDSPDLELFLVHVLENRGATVTVARDGREGVATALSGTFDLLLMDCQMPILDGNSATRELRSRGLAVPIIALTAHAMKGDRERCLEAGATDYLSKPVRKHTLLKLVRSYGRGLRAGATLADGSFPTDGAPNPASGEHTEEAPRPALVRSSLQDDPDIAPIVELFVNSLPARMSAIERAIGVGNREEVMRLAHQLKGSAGAFGFGDLTEPAAELETLARNTGELSAIRVQADRLSRLSSAITGIFPNP